jgi:nucleotide-binding universal stress UspA family protein
MRILFAADGSAHTRRAARHLVRHLGWFRKAPKIELLHVHLPLPLPSASAVVGRAAVEKYYREESLAALKVAERVLDRAGIAYHASWRVGEPAAAIADAVRKQRIELVVMGSHGHGAFANFALGSVATKVIGTVKVPVLVVR